MSEFCCRITSGFFIVVSIVIRSSPVFAQESDVDCDAVYDEIVANYPIDLASCEVEVAPYKLDECKPPSNIISARPTSHMLLAIDASGSMAGKVNGETKMKAAKREALAFLRDMPQEVDVGLVVYGHRGNNQEDGKAESCAASELVHSFDARRRKLEDSIKDLSPTGWTPLGGVLEYAGDIIKDLPPPREGDLAPVVYLISDGEETCGGDPVAAAETLFDAGVKSVVNTIGFDVDAETSAQLEAIADAAGGTYYPAKDAQALRKQLNAIKDAENEMARYQYCANLNAGAIGVVYHNARIELAGCYQRNNPTSRRVAVMHAMNRATDNNQPEAICSDELNDRAKAEAKPWRGWLKEQNKPLTDEPNRLIEEYRNSMNLEATTQVEE